MLNNVVKRVELYGDGKGYIELIDSSDFNASEEGRLKALSLVGICKGKLESKNPSKLKDILAKEGTETNPYGRAFELIPVVRDKYINDNLMISDNLLNRYYKFSHTGDDNVYTNFRTLANLEMLKNIPLNTPEEVKHFKVFRAKIPTFAFHHLKTHTQITSIGQSDRSSTESDYWLPSDLRFRLKDSFNANNPKKKKSKDLVSENVKNGIKYSFTYYPLMQIQSYAVSSLRDFDNYAIKILLEDVPPFYFELFFKTLGYKKEIYQRQMAGFKYKEFIMSGWINDPLTFEHLMELRSHKPTQEQVIEFVDGLKEVLK